MTLSPNIPLFSVLIANYNNGQYMQQAIDSVMAQTYDNWEIVIVDDGSTDNSSEIYKKYESDPRFHIYLNDRNHGCGYTKRRCAELANGEICGFLDPDDELMPDALMLHTNEHLKNSDCAIVYSRCNYCNDAGEIIGTSQLPPFKEGETFFDYRWYGSMHFASYKKRKYKETEGISASLKAGVDQDLYFKVEETGRIIGLDIITYRYYKRHSDKAITSVGNQAELWYWNLVARRDTCRRRNIDEHKILRDDFIFIHNFLIKEENLKTELRIRQSLPYRIGKIILTPFYFVRNIIKKKDF